MLARISGMGNTGEVAGAYTGNCTAMVADNKDRMALIKAASIRIFNLVASSFRRARRAVDSSPALAAATLCLFLTPVTSLAHGVATLAIARFLQAIGHWGLFRHLAVVLRFDPVYASVLDKTVGNIEVQGIAIAGPLGNALHTLASGLFAPPNQVTGGALTAPLVSSGASLLALTLAEAGGEALLIALGLALLVMGLLAGKTAPRYILLSLCFLGVILQVKGVIGLLSLRFSAQDLEIMGVAHVFTKLLPMEASTYRRLADGPLFRSAASLLPLSFVLAVYIPFFIVGILRYRPWRNAPKRANATTLALRHYLGIYEARFSHPVLAVVAILAGAILLPRLSPVLASYKPPGELQGAMARVPVELLPVEPEPAAARSPGDLDPAEPEEAALSQGQLRGPSVARPSNVIIPGANYRYSYIVNGRPERIQGVGYNVMYAGLALEERAVRLDRDFAQMRSVGINTVLGWDEREFDELTLEKAHENGLGVVMPYDLPPNGDYGDPEYEKRLEDDVKEWVQRHKDHPALRMWGIGNEVIHAIGPDSRKARAFGQFYVRLADAVHAIDPDHPVMYRDAEILNRGPICDALQEDGRYRPWFVYGGNFFTTLMAHTLDDWPHMGMDVPLVVSEFAPSGLTPEDRPDGYLRMWLYIAEHPDSVLGGFAYVWSTNGPEPVDRVFGLVNDNNQPADGSLEALGQAFSLYTDAISALLQSRVAPLAILITN